MSGNNPLTKTMSIKNLTKKSGDFPAVKNPNIEEETSLSNPIQDPKLTQ